MIEKNLAKKKEAFTTTKQQTDVRNCNLYHRDIARVYFANISFFFFAAAAAAVAPLFMFSWGIYFTCYAFFCKYV